MIRIFIKRQLPLLTAALACFFSGCFLLTPEDPPLETKTLYPNDFAWNEIDLRINPEYYPDKPLDCPAIQSILTGTGRCLPKSLPFGAAIECPLAYPAETLVLACITTGEEKIPAAYLRLKWSNNAKNITLGDKFGSCQMSQAGPLANEKLRYPTDPGYKVCLFEPNPNADELNKQAAGKKKEEAEKVAHAKEAQTDIPEFTPGTESYSKSAGQLKGSKDTERPAGLFIDFAENPDSIETLENGMKFNLLNAPAELVLDARLLDQSEREQAIKDLIVIFDFYRNQQFVPEMK